MFGFRRGAKLLCLKSQRVAVRLHDVDLVSLHVESSFHIFLLSQQQTDVSFFLAQPHLNSQSLDVNDFFLSFVFKTLPPQPHRFTPGVHRMTTSDPLPEQVLGE